MRNQRDVQEALSMIQNAAGILMKSLKDRTSSTRNLADGVEKLDLALAFVLGRDQKIPLCPNCGSLFAEKRGNVKHLCISCDQEWELLAERNDHDVPRNERGFGFNAAGQGHLGKI